MKKKYFCVKDEKDVKMVRGGFESRRRKNMSIAVLEIMQIKKDLCLLTFYDCLCILVIASLRRGRVEGASFESRALPAEYLTATPPKPYTKYKVIKEIPSVKKGAAAPWFNQPGMGTQYELPYSIDELLQGGFIIKIN